MSLRNIRAHPLSLKLERRYGAQDGRIDLDVFCSIEKVQGNWLLDDAPGWDAQASFVFARLKRGRAQRLFRPHAQ